MAGIDENTLLMIHADGEDESTTFTDESENARTVTANGTAQVDTAQKVFGTGSFLKESGSANYVSTPESSDFRFLGDFTIDFRIRWDSSVPASSICGVGNRGGSSYPKWMLTYNGGGTLGFHSQPGGNWVNWSWTPSADTWYHVAVVRSGTSWYLFVDGVQTGGTQTNGFTIPDLTGYGGLTIGKDAESWRPNYNAWFDEIRISDTARWTSDFTPPSSAYGDVPRVLECFHRKIFPVDRVPRDVLVW